MAHGSDRTGGGCSEALEAIGNLSDGVAVAHPHEYLARQPQQDIPGLVDLQPDAAVFAGLSSSHLAAEKLTGDLHAVTNAKHRHAQFEDVGVTGRGPVGIDA